MITIEIRKEPIVNGLCGIVVTDNSDYIIDLFYCTADGERWIII